MLSKTEAYPTIYLPAVLNSWYKRCGFVDCLNKYHGMSQTSVARFKTGFLGMPKVPNTASFVDVQNEAQILKSINSSFLFAFPSQKRHSRCTTFAFRILTPLKTTRPSNSRFQMATYLPEIGFRSRQTRNNDDYPAITPPQHAFSNGPARMESEDADIDMTDLDTQLPNNRISTSSLLSSSHMSSADEHRKDNAPPTATETGFDNSNALLEAIASMSMDASPQPPAKQPASRAAVKASADSSTASYRRNFSLFQCHADRPTARRPARPVSRVDGPATVWVHFRAPVTKHLPDVLSRTNRYIFSRESSASDRRRWLMMARARESERSRRR